MDESSDKTLLISARYRASFADRASEPKLGHHNAPRTESLVSRDTTRASPLLYSRLLPGERGKHSAQP